MIMKLTRSKSEDTVDSRVIKFFEIYDQTQLQLIAKNHVDLKTLKEHNKKVLNKQAFNFTETSECENLFLDSVEVCRKDVVKRQIEFASTHQNFNQINNLKDMGLSGHMLMEGVCTKKDDLIFMFEQIFGQNQMKREIPRSLRS